MDDPRPGHPADDGDPSAHRAGYVALVGRPNVGKSTLLNHLLGQKLAITSRKPQTTRTRILGLLNRPNLQAVLLDTPGHHLARSPLNRAMVRAAEGAIKEVDVVLLVVDSVPAVRQAREGRAILSEGERVLLARVLEAGHPVILGLNKVDLVEVDWLLPVIDAWRQQADFAAVVPFSALKGTGVPDLVAEIHRLLPEHPPFFPKDQLTDCSERFVVAEIIREKCFHLLQEELPYSVAVDIELFEERTRRDGQPLVHVAARILVERPGQKAIVIGRGGQMLKRIGTAARREIQALLGCAVHLELFVRVEPDWTRRTRLLRELGYE